jgi:site-specific DNA-cytosine methylase
MRMLSVREAMRAMSFRESYQLPDRSRDAMKMLGNAVPPLAAARIITALQAAA